MSHQFRLAQQFLRNNDLHILVGMILLHQRADDFSRLVHPLQFRDGNRDLTELDDFAFPTAGAAGEHHVADAGAEGFQRDIHIHVVVLRVKTAADSRGRIAPFGFPHDNIEVVVDLNGLAHRVGESEEFLSRLFGYHTDIVGGIAVAILNEPATVHAQVIQVKVLGCAADQSHFRRILAIANLAPDFAHRHRLLNHRNVGDHALVVVSQHAIGNEQGTAQFGRCLGGLDAAHDDVVGAQILDLLLGLIADSLAHGDEPDHGHDANQNPQHGEAGPKLVQEETVDPQPESQEDASEHVAIPA